MPGTLYFYFRTYKQTERTRRAREFFTTSAHETSAKGEMEKLNNPCYDAAPTPPTKHTKIGFDSYRNRNVPLGTVRP